MKRFVANVTVVVAIACVILGLAVPATRPSNCGGNTAALFVCGQFAATARINAEDDGGAFDFWRLPDDEKKRLATLAHYHWIPSATFLVRRESFNTDRGIRQIIAVCDKAYGNVPQPTLWNGYKKTPAHAAAYSDGSAGLISPAQFQSLNLADFTDASELISTNSIASSIAHQN